MPTVEKEKVEGLGEAIAKLRQEQKLTRRELEARAKLPMRMLDHYERGLRQPMLSTMARIAKALGVSVDDVLEQAAICTKRAKRRQYAGLID